MYAIVDWCRKMAGFYGTITAKLIHRSHAPITLTSVSPVLTTSMLENLLWNLYKLTANDFNSSETSPQVQCEYYHSNTNRNCNKTLNSTKK